MKIFRKHVLTRVLAVIMAMLCVSQLSAQKINVTGTVCDKDGEPLIGASVIVVGADKG